MKIKAEDVAFWILILAAFAVILWLLSGSPTTESAIITIGLFILSSELLLWRNHFRMDKNTSISFMKVKKNLEHIKIDIKELRKSMDGKLDNIEKLIKNKE